MTSNTNRATRRGNTLVAGLAFVVGAAALLAVLGQQFAKSSDTPVALLPESGAPGTLTQAISTAQESGKPVVAIATATWCGPCNAYKSSTLADESIQSMLTGEAVTVMIDVDQNQADAQRLGVQYLPTTYIISNGSVVDSRSGRLNKDELTSMVRSAAIN